MAKMIFVNLPVADVGASTAFYQALGFEKNEQFSNERGSAMAWTDTIGFMLLDRGFYSTFTTKPIADTQTESAALFALALDSREEVDRISEAAVAAGGKEAHGPEDEGYMYSRAFWDLDGHSFGPFWMDVAAMGATEQAAEGADA